MSSTAHPLYALLHRLEHAKIHFTLARYRADTVLVSLTLAGARIEVDVFDNGHMEVSRFAGSEAVIGDLALVNKIIDENSDAIC